tara:strand:+ start:103 stop:969 length:867 start_codon:yes stop_codon:yes gene_type:complete
MNLVVSISGGETSGFMGYTLNNSDLSKYETVNFVFANTGQENEETLNFIDKLSRLLDVKIIWLESVTFQDRKSSGYKIVDFDSADRAGKVFYNMIKKYGIPNQAYPHCTRELKNNPIAAWCVDNFGDEYEIAIGIRSDESNRVPKRNVYKTIYPLIEMDLSKDDVIDFWESQYFRLGIENYQGNCKWCWKKSARKLRLISYENEDCLTFPDKMEKTEGLSGHNIDGNKRVFFRGNKSVVDILNDRNLMMTSEEVYQHERKLIIDQYNRSVGGDCSQSCEAFSQDDFFN